jgi:ABC-2 type transport system permease protein
MSSSAESVGVATSGSRSRISALRLGWARGGLELKQFFRERDAVVFTFSLPIVFLLIFGSIFHGEVLHTGVDIKQVYVASLTASGIASVSFMNLGVGIAVERDDGTLKRLVGTPAPWSVYFLGKVLMVLAIGVIETVIMLAAGTAFFGITLPSDPVRWFTLAWVFLLGLTTSALLGIAVSSVPRSGRSAAAVLNLPFLVLQFISGIYFPFDQLPTWMQRVAGLFPLKWMAQGLRSVFLPDSFVSAEPAHSWERGRTALVLGIWCLAGLLICLRTFRWKGRRDG